VVTAKDGAPDPRIGTASVTVSVKDVEDEIPLFHKTLYEAKVPENSPDFLVTQVHVCIFLNYIIIFILKKNFPFLYNKLIV